MSNTDVFPNSIVTTPEETPTPNEADSINPAFAIINSPVFKFTGTNIPVPAPIFVPGSPAPTVIKKYVPLNSSGVFTYGAKNLLIPILAPESVFMTLHQQYKLSLYLD
jgi:hypothetical protein